MDNQIIYQLILSVLFGGILGFERKFKRKEAGLQTYSLVSLGTCLFTIIALQINGLFPGGVDVLRIIQAIAVGIGFIGAGVIFHQPSGIAGLTTAAGLWVTSAIGMAVGLALYNVALLATFIALAVFVLFGWLEMRIFKID